MYLVHLIICKLDFLKTDNLFVELISGEGRVWMRIKPVRRRRITFASHQPAGSVVRIPENRCKATVGQTHSVRYIKLGQARYKIKACGNLNSSCYQMITTIFSGVSGIKWQIVFLMIHLYLLLSQGTMSSRTRNLLPSGRFLKLTRTVGNIRLVISRYQ